VDEVRVALALIPGEPHELVYNCIYSSTSPWIGITSN
jgi:hypothetical protein